MLMIGNCRCWAVILKFIYGGKIFTVKQELGNKAKNIPHYMLRKPDGRVVHFKRVCNILPPPFSNFLFLGVIETSGKNRKKRGSKNGESEKF